MRTFIAVNLPEITLTQIEQICAFFKQKTPSTALKWVEPDHMHLTVKFLGEIDENQVKGVLNVLTESVQECKPFEIEVNGLGMYPDQNRPRVIWLGITGAEPLVKLHKTLDHNLAQIGIKAEGRAFSPHLTIARVRKHADQPTVKLIGQTLSQFKVDPLGINTIDQVHLYQSVLTPAGPIYTTLLSVHLNQV